jgi:plastocyanin
LVPRRVTRSLLLVVAGLLGLLASGMVAAPAQAGSTRVSITDFQWSKDPQIDLGESVTWDWLGPDTQHSVSGRAPNASQWDSDPGTVRAHPLGHTFKVTFDLPGVYNFVCKLHASVRGSVTVSSNPGDPFSDPGPQPPLNLDIVPPNLQNTYLTRSRFANHGKGTGLTFQSNERGTASADYYRLVTRGRGRNRRTVRRFVGFSNWNVHVGINLVNFARRGSNFNAKPGRYAAVFFATDESSNSTTEQVLRFQVVRPKRPRR